MTINAKAFILRGADRLPAGAAKDAAAEQARAIKQLADALVDALAQLAAATAVLNDGSTLIVRLGGTCPTGWVEDTTFAGRFPVGQNLPGLPAGTIGGNTTHTHTTTSGATQILNFNNGTGVAVSAAATGHNHNISTADHTPPFKAVTFCKKA